MMSVKDFKLTSNHANDIFISFLDFSMKIIMDFKDFLSFWAFHVDGKMADVNSVDARVSSAPKWQGK